MDCGLWCLKSVIASWLSSSPTSWAIAPILATLCGLGLLLLFLPYLQRNPCLRPPWKRRRNIRKRPVEPRGRSGRTRKKSGASKASRGSRQGLEGAWGLISLLLSSPGRLLPEGSSRQPPSPESPAEEDGPASAGAHQPCGKPVQDDALATSPAVPLAPRTEHPLPRPQPTLPRSDTCDSGAHSKGNLAKFSPPAEKHPSLGTQGSLAPSASPLPAPSPECAGTRKAPGGTLPGDSRGPSEAPLTGRGRRPPSHTLTLSLSLTGRSRQSGTVERGAERRRPGPATGRGEPREERGAGASRDPCQGAPRLEVDSACHSSKAQEAWEVGEALWEAVLADVAVPWRNPASQRSGKSPSPPTKPAALDPKELCPKVKPARKFDWPGKAAPENQPQGCTAGTLLRDSPARGPRAPDGSASHGSVSRGQREDNGGDGPAGQMPRDLDPGRGWSSQGRQQPGRPKGKTPRWSPSNLLPPIDESEEHTSPEAGEDDDSLAGPRASRARGTSHRPRVRGSGHSLGSQSLQLLPEKEQVSADRRFWRRVRYFLPCFKADPEDRVAEDPLAKGKPGSATAQSRGPVKSRWLPDSDGGAVEAPSTATCIGRALGEKSGLCRALRASKWQRQKKRLQAWVAGHSCYHRVPSSPEQTRGMPDGGHQASPRGQSWPKMPRKPISFP
ncbi:spermatogenesis-associated protein 31E1-like [Diceros bicornis minor]|uniref:spermatogenesis-associated protein 31E1-like n=1 Tax=Diceros bicornis minor TaxID=77932 RepID=UPI0026E9325A|nr:spermatogenesis-associated protein 31E1-like [Diceros bicornis minor]XP_058400967.1 spermatogenesis-associated protein 31E1-like [Diceros bicornis minor]XP_058400968.1 spermatogenesis-associated protein 31E1-like [Diceros bicornis minor]